MATSLTAPWSTGSPQKSWGDESTRGRVGAESLQPAVTLPRYEPMLAQPWPAPFSHRDWWFEVKWDGVRVLAYVEESRLGLRSRRGRDVTHTYPELSSLRLDPPAVLDGEVVALGEDGRPSFALLQQRMNLGTAGQARQASESVPVTYMAFDLLYHGTPLVGRPIEERRERLAALALPAVAVRPEPIEADGEVLFAAIRQQGLEGMVAKRKGSLYRSGLRSPDWRKVASRHNLRAVVGGFTLGGGGRAHSFGGLLVGLWQGGTLRFVGSVGSGFNEISLVQIRGTLDQLRRPTSPFTGPVEILGEPAWVEPTLVAVIEYKEWTPYGRLRAPVFKGFAPDLPESLTWETEGPG